MPHAATSTAAAPFAKLVELGDTLIGAWGGAVRRQARDYESGALLFKRDDPTKQQLEEQNWLIVMPGSTAKLGTAEDGFTVIEPGAEVRWSFGGFKWKQVIDARKNLPAVAEHKLRAGQEASSDVYTITLVGWSKATEKPEAARKAGFTVEDGRIILRTDEDADKCVAALRKAGGNTNLAKDYEVTVRRADPAVEGVWMEAADLLWLRSPWEQTAAPADDLPPAVEEESPFADAAGEDPF
jgi:hypothetical protein